MLCVRASFLKVSYLTCCVFFLPFFFTISGESSRQVTQMEKRKSGRAPEKWRRVLAGYSLDFEFLHSSSSTFFYVTIVPVAPVAPRRTRRI